MDLDAIRKRLALYERYEDWFYNGIRIPDSPYERNMMRAFQRAAHDVRISSPWDLRTVLNALDARDAQEPRP